MFLRAGGDYFEKLLFPKEIPDGVDLDEVIQTLATACEDVAYLIGVTHDFGKASGHFQKYLEGQISKSHLTRHAHLSSLFTIAALENYIANEHLAQLKGPVVEFLRDIFPFIGYFVVKHHHVNLPNFRSELRRFNFDSKHMKEQFDDLDDELSEIFNKLLFNLEFNDVRKRVKKTIKGFEDERSVWISHGGPKRWQKYLRGNMGLFLFFLSRLLYAALLQADKMDAAFDSNYPERPNLNLMEVLAAYRVKEKHDKPDPAKELNVVREEIFRCVTESVTRNGMLSQHVLSINVPTGYGKTLAAVGASFAIREGVGDPRASEKRRVIYCLPYLSIIDQNFKVLRDVFGEGRGNIQTPLLLSHHHLSELGYQASNRNGTFIEGSDAKLLVEGWEGEVVVTTYHQFLNTLFSNRNALVRRLVKYPESIFILDEIQTVPLKYWPLIREALKFLGEVFDSKIIQVTATLPRIFEPDEY
ncbi:MAG: CRISPR-associated endonuclease Cas3'', partial [Promethearchaeota archaeon]